MTKEAFIEKFVDILQTEEIVTVETILTDLEEWDSLNILAVVSWLLENKIKVTVKEISTCKTVGDIIKTFIV